MSDKRFYMIQYDGINLFYNGEWTGLDMKDVEEGRNVIGFLETLTDEQAEHWIRVEKYKKGTQQTFNRLKYNQEFTGETTCNEHIQDRVFGRDDWKNNKGAGPECIQAQNVFEAQWTNCPKEVERDIQNLWRTEEFGNDNFYYRWVTEFESDAEEGYAKTYPVLAGYLKSRGITECLIHWWW